MKAYLNFGQFNEFKRSYSGIKSFKVYTYNKTLLNNWEFIPTVSGIQDQQWYKKVMEKNGEVVWQYIWNELYKRRSLCLTRRVKDEYNQKLGVLVIEINSSYLQSIIAEEPFTTVIAVDDGTMVYSNDLFPAPPYAFQTSV